MPIMPKTNRRTFLLASGMGCAALACRPAMGASTSDVRGLIEALRNPPLASRPQIRWWWPGGATDNAILRREANAIADAGFGGFEIADVRDSLHAPIDPATLGWATPAWNRAIETALIEAVRRKMAMSITLGPHWPTGIPGVRPDDDAAAKEMVHGIAHLTAGQSFSGPIPPPAQPKPSGWIAGANEHPIVMPMLLSVQAWCVVENGPTPLLDSDSRIDLSPYVRDGALSWQAPDKGDWMILSFWTRGTAQIQNMFAMNRQASMLADPVPYVLDIYGAAAVSALTGFWESHVLTPQMRALLPRAGGTLFEDSLEMSASCAWTPGAQAEFAKRCGYDLAPFLPLLVSRAPTMEDIVTGAGRPVLFRLSGVDDTRVRHDYEEMLSSLYIENRIAGLSRWARSLGLEFRVQAVGSDINSARAAAFAPIPEGDNSNDIHGWRRMAAGRDIGGRQILSDEAGTFVKGIAHVATWKDLLYMLQRDMAGGANQMMLHGFSHASAPGASWPGFSAFGRAIGNDWGPRDPNWTMAGGITAYIGRLQHALRQGVNRCDLAVLGAPLHSQSVLHAGYTFAYPDMDLLQQPQMVVRNGRLMAQGPAYRAMVLSNLSAIDPAAMRRLLEYSAGGLPVVIIGPPPLRARGWADHRAADADVAAMMQTLLARANVRQVATQKALPDALAALGVAGTMGFSAPARLMTIHRQHGDMHLFYILNDSDVSVRQTVKIAAPGMPHHLDLWSGDIHALPAQRDGERASVELDLAANEPAVLLFTQRQIAPPAPPPMDHAPIALGQDGWQVTFDDWHAGDTLDTIRHELTSAHLETLQPWSDLPGRGGMAGTARYEAQWRIEPGDRFAGAELSLGQVLGTATVCVNGFPAQVVNPFTGRIRVGSWMKVGVNHVIITVASALNNRLVADGIADLAFAGPGGGDAPPPPKADPAGDPDMVDGPKGLAGMQPGAAPPGAARKIMPFGLMGPVRLFL